MAEQLQIIKAPKKLAKWKLDFLVEINSLDSEELLSAYTDMAGGDEYDGCFTTRGLWHYQELQKEFRSRLTSCGFFGKRKVWIEKNWSR